MMMNTFTSKFLQVCGNYYGPLCRFIMNTMVRLFWITDFDTTPIMSIFLYWPLKSSRLCTMTCLLSKLDTSWSSPRITPVPAWKHRIQDQYIHWIHRIQDQYTHWIYMIQDHYTHTGYTGSRPVYAHWIHRFSNTAYTIASIIDYMLEVSNSSM